MVSNENTGSETKAGTKVLKYIDLLAQISQEDGKLTRLSLTEQHRQANAQVGILMQSAGMKVRTDAIGNVIGRLEGTSDKRALLLGSHLDTVRDADPMVFFKGGYGSYAG